MSVRYHKDINFEASRISYIRIDGYYFPLKDISETGFKAAIKDDFLTVGDVVDAEIIIDDKHGSIRFDIDAEIISSENKCVSGKWDLSKNPKEKTVISYFKNRYNTTIYNDLAHKNAGMV